MEKTSAARAIEWSIDLEKSLRSKKPGQDLEAIKRMGPRLDQWCREPEVNMSESNMFGLIHGEERLFANAILLRLADAFTSGSKQIKVSVVKLFLSLWKNCRKRGFSQVDRVMSKLSSTNRLEVLRRVKVVFDSGDTESRALALTFFGCLVSIAKDRAEIRYLVLSSLMSSEVLEVKASLFAAGCFSELADDFASVFFEILVKMVTSSDLSWDVRLVGVRLFSKIGSSLTLANKAYKIGLKLLLDSLEEDLSRLLLISLSSLASRSICLISGQVNLLFTFLSPDKPLLLKVTALRCLQFIAAREICDFSSAADSLEILIHMLEESSFSPLLCCGALNLLQKVMLSYALPTTSHTIMLEIPKLFIVLKNAVQSSICEERVSAIGFLIDLAHNITGKKDATFLVSRIILFVIDQINWLVRQVQDLHQQDGQSLLGLLIYLVENYPDLGSAELDKICSILEYLLDSCDQFEGQDERFFASKVFLCLSKFIVCCLQKFDGVDYFPVEVLQKIKIVLKRMLHCSLFDCHTQVLYYLYLQSHLTHHFMLLEMKDHNERAIQDYLVQNTVCNWSIYKIGKYAACQGSWSIAALVFETLKAIVKSKTFYMWLMSLEQLAHSEMKIQLLFHPNQVEWKIKLRENMDKLIEALDGIQSSRDCLQTIKTSRDEVFSFQRWFISIRQRILACTLDILKLCGDYESHIERNMQISFQLLKVARELDLITSLLFIGMNKRNLEIFQALALSCSMLAFTTGFSLSFSTINDDGSENLNTLNSTLAHDLFWRLELVEAEVTKELGSILRNYGPVKCGSFLHSRNRLSSSNGDARGLLKICGDAVASVVGLEYKSNRGNDGTSRQISMDGLQLLLDTVAKWMCIPFRMPNRFFQMRPFISCELFASNSTKHSEEISVKQGFHLSLNLCIQLKNIPDDLSLRGAKIYCILQCESSSCVLNRCQEEQIEVDWPESKVKDMVDLNDKLCQHIVNESYMTSCERSNKEKGDDLFMAETVVLFKPNESGIGFSTCLFDVSNFGVGCYKIKWHSCLDSEDSCWSLFPINSGPVFTVVQEKHQ